jgi:hypothetical protein
VIEPDVRVPAPDGLYVKFPLIASTDAVLESPDISVTKPTPMLLKGEPLLLLIVIADWVPDTLNSTKYFVPAQQ